MNRLKELREKSGLSVHELASKAGLDQFLVGQLEDGPGLTDQATVDKLIGVLNEGLAGKNTLVRRADLDSLVTEVPSSEISKQESQAAVARTGENSTDTERDLQAGQVYPHTRAGYDDPRDPPSTRPATGGPASQPEERQAASYSSDKPDTIGSTSQPPANPGPTVSTQPVMPPTVSPSQSSGAKSPLNEVYDAAISSVKSGITPVSPASADGGRPKPEAPSEPASSATPVATKPPTYTSYASKKEAKQANLFMKLIPALIALLVFGLIIMKLIQIFQAEKEGLIVPLDEVEVDDIDD